MVFTPVLIEILMKASREFKQWVNNSRSKLGKKNGSLPRWVWDNPEMEIHESTSKKNCKLRGLEDS